MAIEAMNAGKHAYVEKPLAMNKAEAEAMIASAEGNACAANGRAPPAIPSCIYGSTRAC